MAHTTITDSQNDGFFTIDPITRVISPSGKKTKVMQYDHNSERFFFQMTTPIEGHPMEECNKVEVHYINGATTGVYDVCDLIHQKTSHTTEQVIFSWILSQNVTKNAGVISFLIRFSCVAEDGTIEYAWNTEPCMAMSVSKGIYNSDAIVEQYADVLEQWKAELNSGGGLSATAINLLLSILREGVYTSDQSANINALESALGEGYVPDVPDTPEQPENGIVQTGSTLAITSGVTATQNGTTLTIS